MSYQGKIFLAKLTPKELAPCKLSHIFRCAFKFNFKFTEATFFHTVFGTLNCVQYCLGQMLVIIEKLLNLYIVVFMPLEIALLSNFYLESVNLLSIPNVDPKNGIVYKQKNVYVMFVLQ